MGNRQYTQERHTDAPAVSFALTEGVLVAAYELLCETPPFRGWKMPPSHLIKFKVIRTLEFEADCHGDMIRVSANRVSSLATLMPAMCHEMTHLYQMLHGLETPKADHNADFRKRAKRICRLHGFDIKAF